MAAIMVVLALWVGGRSILWETPFPQNFGSEMANSIPDILAAGPESLTQKSTQTDIAIKDAANLTHEPGANKVLADAGGAPSSIMRDQKMQFSTLKGAAPTGPGKAGQAALFSDEIGRVTGGISSAVFPPIGGEMKIVKHTFDRKVSTSHQMLWMAAMVKIPVPDHIVSLMEMRGLTKPQKHALSKPPKSIGLKNSAWGDTLIRGYFTSKGAGSSNERSTFSLPLQSWTLDSWLLYRPQSNAASQNGQFAGQFSGPLPSSYGGSQAGAVLHYYFSKNSPYWPAAYLRATKALSGTVSTLDQAELASGLSVRPIKGLAVSARGEMRLRKNAGKTDVRPAIMAVSHFQPVKLPLDLSASTYAQAGYVAGKDATAFADGQLRIDRELAAFDLGKIRTGAGLWGGAQKGASRLDVGPSVSLDVKLGEAPARISMDYRHRLAGNAEPQSGAVITLSAGF